MNNQGPIQGVDSHFRPALAINASPVVPPQVRGRSFEVRPQCLGILPCFYGKAIEECNTLLSCVSLNLSELLEITGISMDMLDLCV
jgi:hypothetical protein